ncbi:mechanosensitive ion channel family protein [Pseudomonas zhanjiangensis]|uniref:Small-conductance mechanosensitive channel n=1 Tax=Pseudomonas zhanjiangensis TaxID=3239015 RepID=A0ABV3YW38_9PSED
MNSIRIDIDEVIQRLLNEAYGLLAALPLLALAVLVVWLAWLVGRWLSRRALLARLARRNPFLRELIGTTVHWAVVLVGLLAALEIMDATALVGAVLGTAGVLGIALGFAFKDTLENYLAGILMSLRQPFAPRDHVVIDGNEGLIIALTSRATILMTPDGNHLRLPNALVFRSVTLNYTRNPSRRFMFDVGLATSADVLIAQRIGIDQLEQLEGVLHTPPPRTFIDALGDSSVQLRYLGWVDQRTHDFLMIRSEAIRRVTLALEAAGIDLPEPTWRLHIQERTQAAAAAPLPHRAEPPPAPTEVDTRVIRDLAGQIDQDLQASESQDLLDPAAPRE